MWIIAVVSVIWNDYSVSSDLLKNQVYDSLFILLLSKRTAVKLFCSNGIIYNYY